MSATASAAGQDGQPELKLEGASKPISSSQKTSKGAASRGSTRAADGAAKASAPTDGQAKARADGTGRSSRSRSHTVSDAKNATGPSAGIDPDPAGFDVTQDLGPPANDYENLKDTA